MRLFLPSPAGSVESTSTGTVAAPVSYAEGTITHDDDEVGAAGVFKQNQIPGGLTSTVEASTDDNKTNVEKWVSGAGNPRGGGYQPFLGTHALKGSEVKISFDFKFNGIKTYVSIHGNTDILSNRNGENAKGTGKVITFNGGNETADKKLYVYTGSGDDEATCEEIPNATREKWYHIETVSDVATEKKVTVKVYNYKADNNYTSETPLLEKTYPFRDTAVDGISGFSVCTKQNSVTNYIDNIYINDATFDGIFVTTDGNATVNKEITAAGETVEITPVAKNGQKVKSVTVNGATDNLEESGGKYTYTVQEGDEAVDVKVVYTRSDVKSIEIAGDATVKKGEAEAPHEVTYTATVKDTKDYDFTKDEVEVVWELRDEAGTSVTSVDGVTLTEDPENQLQATLSVSSALASATKVTVTAKVATNIDVPETYSEGKKAVSLVTENVYNILATNVTPEGEVGGTVHVNVKDGDSDISQITENATLQVVAEPKAGYTVESVKYATKTASGEQKAINNAGGNNYEVAMNTINDDITIYVVFKANDLTIANSSASDIEIAVNGTVTSDLTKVHVGDKINVYAVQNKKISTLTVQETEGSANVDGVTGHSFTMPAKNVTVSATTEEWNDGKYFEADFNHVTTGSDGQFKLTEKDKVFDSTGEGTLKGAWETSTSAINRQTTVNVEEVVSESDQALKFTFTDNNRSKSVYKLTDAVSLAESQSTKMSFDFKMTNAYDMTGTNDKNCATEISFVNSDNDLLFAIRWNRQRTSAGEQVDHKLQIYATEPANLTTGKVSYRDESGKYDNRDAWGSNAFVMTAGLTPAQVQKEAADVTPAADTWYTAEVTFTGTQIDVKISAKSGGEELGSATFDLTGKKDLKRDLKSIIFFLDSGSASAPGASGNYISFDNLKAQAGWVEE